MKAQLKQKGGTPPEAVGDLSPDPMHFRHNYPVTFNAVFCAAPPVHPKISMITAMSVWEGTNMRARPPYSSGFSAEPAQENVVLRFMEMALQSMVGGMQSGQPRLQLSQPSSRKPLLDRLPSTRSMSSLGWIDELPATPLRQSPTSIASTTAESSAAAPLLQSPISIAPTTSSPGHAESEGLEELGGKLQLKRSVDDAASLIMSAMAERKAAAESAAESGPMKRPAAKQPRTGPMKKPAAATTRAGTGEKAPYISDEASRSQIMFRTGLKGDGQSKSFRYRDAKSKAAAIAKAKARGVVARLGAVWGFAV